MTIDAALCTVCAEWRERWMMRIAIMLALPVGVLLIFLTVTILLSWVSGTGLCGTWMAPILPYCG